MSVAKASNRCREARELSGLTMGQAAHRLGISQSLLAGIETADRTAGPELQGCMAALYDVHPAWISGRSPESLSPDDPRVNQAQLAKLTAADRVKFLRTMAAVLGPPEGG